VVLLQERHSGKHQGDANLSSNSKLKKVDLPGLNDFYYLEDSRGKLYTFGLLISQLVNRETLGDYAVRLRDAAVAHEVFGKDLGKKAKAIRVSPIEGAHMATDHEEVSAAPSVIPADSFTGLFEPADPVERDPSKIITPVLNALPGYESALDRYERGAEKLLVPKLSTSGYGSAFIGALGVNFKIGSRGKKSNITTLDMLVETLLTKYASFYERFPGVSSLSRQSFGKKDIDGLAGLGMNPHEFSFSLPLECKNPKDELRNQRAKGEIIPLEPDTSIYADVFNMPPEEWKDSENKELRDKYQNAVPVKYRAAYEGKTNPDSGNGMARIVVVSTAEPGQDGELAILKHRLRVQQAIANWCEEFCAPAELSDAEKAAYPGYARVPGTFSIMESMNGKNYAQIEAINAPRMYETVVQIPYKELSLIARTFPQTTSTGALATYLINEHGQREIIKPSTQLYVHGRRDLRNAPGREGAFGQSGGGMKMIEIDYPYSHDTLHIYEDLVCATYANACTDEFENTSYAYDSFQGGNELYNLGVNREPNNRSQIYLAGWHRLIQAMEEKPQDSLKGLQENSYTEIEIDGKLVPVDRAGNENLYLQSTDYSHTSTNAVVEGGVEKRILNDRVYQVWRELNGQWPEVFKDSTWLGLVQALYDDLKEACQVKWLDDEKKRGYLVLDRMVGVDNELPAVIYNLLLAAAVANSLDDLNKDLPPGKRVSWKQTDLSRSWPSPFFVLRDPKIAAAMKAMGVDPRYLPEDEIDPSIVVTNEDAVSFRYRFTVRVDVEDIPYKNLPNHLKKARIGVDLNGFIFIMDEDDKNVINNIDNIDALRTNLDRYRPEAEQTADNILLQQFSSIATSAFNDSVAGIDLIAITDPVRANNLITDSIGKKVDGLKTLYTSMQQEDIFEQQVLIAVKELQSFLGVTNIPDDDELLSSEYIQKTLDDLETALANSKKSKKISSGIENFLRTKGILIASAISNINDSSSIFRYAYLFREFVPSYDVLAWRNQTDAQQLYAFLNGDEELPAERFDEMLNAEKIGLVNGLIKQRAYRAIDSDRTRPFVDKSQAKQNIQAALVN
jgi:hypothetical protein